MKMKYENIIKQMTLAEKARMMSGKNTWETVDFEKYGIPSMTMSDGPPGWGPFLSSRFCWNTLLLILIPHFS